jgi:nitroimidazol reductase NimA-like FMN-containing flavoprotein (pyridoxamine 5'-phosphate oxidase superfamily)
MKRSNRTQLSRKPNRGSYDPAVIYPILDEGLFCHVSYQVEGQPYLIPMAYCRLEDTLYLHGSVGSHFMRELAKGTDVCLAVTLMDGLVLARSAFAHSVNYRSVIVFGRSREITDEAERWRVFEQVVEHLIPGRWNDSRQPNASELTKTMLIAIPMEEASAKVRTGGVGEEPASDLELPYWAGVIPLSVRVGTPRADATLGEDIGMPRYIEHYTR